MPRTRREPQDAPPWRELGDAIYRARVLRHLNQQQVAMRADVSDSYIAKIEKGGARPTPETLGRIARAVGLDYDDLGQLAGYMRRTTGEVEQVTVEKPAAGRVRRFAQLSIRAMDRLLMIADALDAEIPLEGVADEHGEVE